MNQTSKFSVRDICYAGLFAAVIAVMAQISIPMPLGVPMTMQTFAITLAAVVLGSKLSAIATLVYLLLGAVGGPKWDDQPGSNRPEKGLLAIREDLGLFANLRPAKIFAPLKSASPIKEEIIGDGLDILIVRELTGGIYFGDRGTYEENGVVGAYDTERYTYPEIKRIVKAGFEYAMKRDKRLTCVDKANVLDSSRLWRKIVEETKADYPQVEVSYMYVDNCAMQLVRNPNQFDVIVTSNIFGDILSDEASMISGSIGMLASASLAEGTVGLYQPIHGSAPDIAGQGKANPLATILSGAMMLRYTFGEMEAAQAIEDAGIRH